MIEIITADNCGFCFGVRRAVDMLAGEIETGGKIYLFGEIIHNDSFIKELKKKGVIVIDDDFKDFKDFGELEENSSVVIRAHGIPKPAFEKLLEIKERKNIKIADATCECVKRMHAIAEENTNANTLTLIFGDENHPEIAGLRSYVNGESVIYKNFDALKEDFGRIKQVFEKNHKKLIILVQTTHNINDYNKCKDHILGQNSGPGMTDTVFFDTICGATQKRQAEAGLLSESSDIMIVVGGPNSSNTAKLYEICKKKLRKFFYCRNFRATAFKYIKRSR